MSRPAVGLVERKYLRRLVGATDGASVPDAVVLVGSWARGTQVHPISDIDVLVIGECDMPSPVGRIQVIRRSADEFRRLVMRGDDFAQWSLRFGRPLRGRQLWTALRDELLGVAPWPSGRSKLELAKRRLKAAEDLLAMGDLDAAGEETRYGLSHLARAVLLEAGVFPLSRPELPGQLEEIDEHELASAVSVSLRDGPTDRGRLEAALTLLASRVSRSAPPQGDSQARKD